MRSCSRFAYPKIVLCALLLSVTGSFALAQTPAQEAEGTGEGEPREIPERRREDAIRALQIRGQVGLLLIPESTNDRVMAFDPMTGDLVDANFIPADPDNLSTPICAIAGFAPNTILVSDQIDDVVQMYDATDGSYLGVFAPAGGADVSILDNVRGIARSPANTLLVSVGGGDNADAIAEFDSDGTYLGNYIANGSGGLDSPFDILVRDGDNLVAGINSDNILRYDTSGAFLDEFTPVDNFTEQVHETASGNILVGNFSGGQVGVVEFTATGTLVGVYDNGGLSGYRGAYELPNGNILTTTSDGVHEIDRNGTLIETKIAGVNARFIEFLGPSIVCEDMGALIQVGEAIVVTGNDGCIFDMYDTNCSDDPADWTLLASGLTIDAGGVHETAIVAQPDTCYAMTVTGTQDPAFTSVQTIPILGPWGLAAFASLLTILGVIIMRRRPA